MSETQLSLFDAAQPPAQPAPPHVNDEPPAEPAGPEPSAEEGSADPVPLLDPITAHELYRPPRGAKSRVDANLAALKVLRDLEVSGGRPDGAQRSALGRWSGWGAVAGVFDEHNGSLGDRYDDVRKALADPDAYAAANRTVLNAHYTSPTVAQAMWDWVGAAGLNKGRGLEIGCGAGMFMVASPASWQMTGIEADPTTAAIAAHLAPDADVTATPVQHWTAPAGDGFDLMIGNVPFSSARPFDPRYAKHRHLSLHNYCLLRGLAALRPGGLLISVTSMYTMDALNSSQRRDLSRWGRFLGAVRLPGGAFRENAGTDATTDIVVMSRRAEPLRSLDDVELTGSEQAWLRTVEHEGFKISGWFSEHPELMLGDLDVGTMYGRSGHRLVERPGTDLGSALHDALGSAPMLVAAEAARERLGTLAPPKRLGTAAEATHADERVRQPTAEDAAGRATEGTIVADGQRFLVLRAGWFVPFKLPTGRRDVNPSAAELRAVLRVRDAALALMDAEVGNAADETVEAARAELNAAYDAHHALGCGRLSRRPLNSAGKPRPFRLSGFREDPHYELVRSLEDPDLIDAGEQDVRGPWMRRRMIRRDAQDMSASVATVADAVAVSMWRTGGVWPDLVGELLGREVGPDDLAPSAFFDPQAEEWQTAAQYLSGDIPAKLEAARAAGEGMERNIEALADATPDPVAAEDIGIELGTPLVTPDEVQQFANEMLRGRHHTTAAVEVVRPAGDWQVTTKSWITEAKRNEEWGTKRIPAERLLRKLLNRESLLVHHPSEPGRKRTVDKMATLEASQAAERWQQAFVSWCFEDDVERCDMLVERYNRIYNARRVPEYPEWVRPPGLADDIDLRSHQASAVTRAVLTRSALLGHEVGLGKTLTMAATAMEFRRLGIAQRPMAVVPLQLVSQFAADFRRFFPAASLLVCDPPTGSGAAYRSRFAAQVATGDWDCVVISYTQFAALPVSIRHSVNEEAEWLSELMQRRDHEAAAEAADHARSASRRKLSEDIEKQTTRLRKSLRQFDPKESRSRDPYKNFTADQVLDVARKSVKQAERDALSREEAARERVATYDGEISFEDLAVDFLFVDEADSFKNVDIDTKDRLILEGGRPKPGSARARDLERKLKWLKSMHGESRAVLATGTPVANKLTELWTMQRFVQPDLLAVLGLERIEAWVAMFGVGTTAAEVGITGEWKMKERLAGYRNLPELLSIVGQNIELLTYERAGMSRPGIAGGQARVIELQAAAGNEVFLEELAARELAVRRGDVDPAEDNMLAIATAARAAAIDLRLVGRHQEEGGKIDRVADEVAHIWQKNKANRYVVSGGGEHPAPGALQMVFLDIGTPEGSARVNLYADLRTKLVERGMDPSRVEFFHDRGKTAAAKDRFDEECRTGGVDVLIASTAKAGAGVNVQDRMVALHHVDPPWRPRDVQQREGRALRPGNQHDPVEINRYVTLRTFDQFSWQVLARKAGFIQQLMSHGGQRRLDDIDTDIRDSFQNTMAIASGDPRLIEEIELADAVSKLRDQRRSHIARQSRIKRTIRHAEEECEQIDGRIRQLERLHDTWQAATHDDEKPTWRVSARPTEEPVAATAQLAANVIRRRSKGRADVGGVGVLVAADELGYEQARVFVGPTAARLDFWVREDDLDSVDIPRRVTSRLKALPETIEQARRRQRDQQIEIDQLEQLQRPDWPHEDELAAKAADLAELSYAIRADADPAASRDFTPDELEDLAEQSDEAPGTAVDRWTQDNGADVNGADVEYEPDVLERDAAPAISV